MRFFSEQQVRQLANVDEVIRAIRAAFSRDFSATLRMPVRTSLDLSGGAVLLLMPCYDSALGAAGVKNVTVSSENVMNAAYEILNPATVPTLGGLETN